MGNPTGNTNKKVSTSENAKTEKMREYVETKRPKLHY